MKNETKVLLDNELSTGKYALFNPDFNLDKLFNLYLSSEIHSPNDIFRSYSDFTEYIKGNAEYFTKGKSAQYERAFHAMLERIVGSFVDSVNEITDCGRLRRIGEYTDVVSSILPKDVRLLDVGAGSVPYSSMVLSKDFYDVTSMDFALSAPKSFLKNFRIKYRDEYFSEDTDIEGYDIISGRRPCSAIEPIVDICANRKKPYLVEICNCKFPGKTVDDIVEYLKSKDKNIRKMTRDRGANSSCLYGFVPETTYIHNLDISDDEAKQILDATQASNDEIFICDDLEFMWSYLLIIWIQQKSEILKT